jgi:hypothetical protein
MVHCRVDKVEVLPFQDFSISSARTKRIAKHRHVALPQIGSLNGGIRHGTPSPWMSANDVVILQVGPTTGCHAVVASQIDLIVQHKESWVHFVHNLLGIYYRVRHK